MNGPDFQTVRYWVDGYNLMFVIPGLRALRHDLPEARKALCKILKPFVEQGHELVLVFDGNIPSEEERDGFRLIFSHGEKGETADKKMIRLLKQEGGEGVVVVSGDKRVATSAKHHAQGVLNSEAFLDLLGDMHE